ncbi:MAG: HEPN domain-containing protein [Chloroflexota bacterium]
MKANEAKRWMEYAKSDLDAAHALLERGNFFPRQICFMAQQAGEKALKSILILLEIPFPIYALSIWAVESRYPGDMPDVVEYEARETLHLAESVFDAVKAELEGRM